MILALQAHLLSVYAGLWWMFVQGVMYRFGSARTYRPSAALFVHAVITA